MKTKGEYYNGRIDEAVLWLPVITHTNWFPVWRKEGYAICFLAGKPGMTGGCPVMLAYIGERVRGFFTAFEDAQVRDAPQTVFPSLYVHQPDIEDTKRELWLAEAHG